MLSLFCFFFLLLLLMSSVFTVISLFGLERLDCCWCFLWCECGVDSDWWVCCIFRCYVACCVRCVRFYIVFLFLRVFLFFGDVFFFGLLFFSVIFVVDTWF